MQTTYRTNIRTLCPDRLSGTTFALYYPMSVTITPTIHLNGSSKERLAEDYFAILITLDKAYGLMIENAPHPRDYYVQGDSAYPKARAEHEARVKALYEIRSDIYTILEAVS